LLVWFQEGMKGSTETWIELLLGYFCECSMKKSKLKNWGWTLIFQVLTH
jgi:hypothetical protein